MKTNPDRRFHAFDSLRGIMMLIGVGMHVACGYTSIPDTWWYTEKNTHWLFDFAILFFHVFRLPVFFVMAGFFAALLMERRGWRGLAVNRLKRLLLPLLLGMAAVYPVMNALQGYTRVWSKPEPLQAAGQFLLSGRYWRWVHPMHFWFLDVFIITTIVSMIGAALWNRLPESVRSRWNAWFRHIAASAAAPFLLAVPTLATLLIMDYGLLDTTHSFLPEPRILLAYQVFFAFGWLLYRNSDLLDTLKRQAWRNVFLATAIGIANFLLVMKQVETMPVRNWPAFLFTAVTGALVVWLMIYGCAGLFLKFLDRRIPAMRYLSDSAYWVYIVHAPVVLWLQILVAGLPVSPLVKTARVPPRHRGELVGRTTGAGGECARLGLPELR
jgi:glucan biosynthesis protein C